MPTPAKTKILVIGTNRYAREVLLPAIYCSIREFEWVGLCGGDPEERALLVARWEDCPVVDRLDACDWAAIDVVAVAEPLERVPDVLQQLVQFPVARTILLLEPPMLPGDRLAACRYFSAFRAVYALADCLGWPHLRAIRNLIAAGKIGTPQKLWLQNSGDRRDTVAIARRFAVGAPVARARRENIGPDGFWDYTLQFSEGFCANILEPYDAEVGRLAIAGSAGTIVDYPLWVPNTIQIGYAFEGERFRGITIDGDLQPIDARDWAFCDRLPYARLPDASLVTLLRIRGLMEVLHGLLAGDATYCYPWREAIADGLLLDVLQRTPLWWDPLAPAGRSLLQDLGSRGLTALQGLRRRSKKS